MKRALVFLLIILTLFPTAACANLLTTAEMTESAAGLAQFTIAGMPGEDYYAAVASREDWTAIITTADPQPIEIDLEQRYSWEDLEDILYAMAAHPTVQLEVIGESAKGRRIYSIHVGEGDKYILLTGGVHAKETAGTMYILKQLASLLNDYADGDAHTMRLLSEFTVIAVPCVNPDGRAVIEQDEGIDWRANDAGIDLGMNFPCANAGQFSPDASQNYHSNLPGPSDYAGDYLGSEPETKALISWLEEYIDSAIVFIDYEQYGRYLHGGSTYLGATSLLVSDYLALNLAEFLSRDDAMYNFLENAGELRGWSGGSITDFAAELAEGLAFSERYGRLGLDFGSGPLPLCFFEDIDDHLSSYTPRSTPFACVTIDISTKGGTGYYDNARRNQAKEYANCGYGDLLVHVMEYALEYLVTK